MSCSLGKKDWHIYEIKRDPKSTNQANHSESMSTDNSPCTCMSTSDEQISPPTLALKKQIVKFYRGQIPKAAKINKNTLAKAA